MRKIFLRLAVLFFASPLSATEWNVLGARAMGMGGAGVAVPNGALNSYWNPAGLGHPENVSGLQIPVGAHAAVTGSVVQGANDLNEIQKDCNTMPGSGKCTQAGVDTALALLNQPESGLRVDTGLGANLKIKKATVFLNNFGYAAGFPRVDMVNTSPAALSAGLNTSRITLRGISVTEIGVGYGQELPFLPGMFLGGNLKGLIGRVGYRDFNVFTEDLDGSAAFKKFLEGSKRSFQPGVDVGALWDINRTLPAVPFRPRVGLTARNINNPKFSQPDQAKLAGEDSKYSLQGQTRAGAAISPLRFWNIAADLDLTDNLTPLDGVTSRQMGLGTEVNVFNRSWINVPLRAGVSRNLAQKGSKTLFSLGGGLNLLHVNVDLAATWSPAKQKVQSQGETKEFPSEFGVAAQLGVLFGGGTEKRETDR